MRGGFLVIAVGLLFALFTSQAPSASADGGVGLEVSTSSQSHQPGQPVVLTMTVTNRTGQPCALAASSVGTVHLTSVVRDGTVVPPSFARTRSGAGFANSVRAELRTVEPGGSVTFPLTAQPVPGSTDLTSLSTEDSLPGGHSLGSVWELASGGHTVTARYQVPPVDHDGPAICAGSTNSATTSFAVASTESAADSDRLKWILIGAGAAGVLGVVVFWAVRRRNRGAAVVVVVLAATVGAGVGGAPRASAYLVPSTKSPVEWLDLKYPQGDPKRTARFDKWRLTFDGCVVGFQTLPGGDPAGIMKDVVSADTPSVFIIPLDGRGSESKGYPVKKPGDSPISVVSWNADDHSIPDPDGVAINDCASLYHELFHAQRHMKGKSTDKLCGSTGIPTDEVEATFAENEYRRKHVTVPAGKPKIREYYDRKKLPASLGDCAKAPPKKTPAERGWQCWGIQQPLLQRPLLLNGQAGDDCSDSTAVTDGDPHLTTFDQRRYDFQAVGEFTMAKSGSDFEVQTRQSPVPDLNDRTVSVNSAVAMRVGADRVVFSVVNGVIAVRVNGTVESPPRGSRTLPGGGTVTRRVGAHDYVADGHTVVWPDGSVVAVDGIGMWGIRLLMSVSGQRKGGLTGLLGDFDGASANDLRTRDGKPVSAVPRHDELYGVFGNSWRISQAESLFDYAAGETTDTFTDRTFPDRMLTFADLTEEQRGRGQIACALAGMTAPAVIEQCVLDVALTGQPVFATKAADTADLLPGPSQPSPPPPPDQPNRVLRDGDVVTGRIDAVGEQDRYELGFDDGTEFRFVDQAGGIAIQPATRGSWTRAIVPNADRLAIAAESDRLVTVTKPDNGIGEYSFRVVTVTPSRFDARLGEAVSGRVDGPGRVNVYAFDAAGVKSIRLVGDKGCDYSVGIAEDAPGPTVSSPYPVWSGLPEIPSGKCGTIPIPVEEEGRFLLVFWSEDGKPFDYEVRVEQL